jgi:ABC-type polar amino acid transport system ATPase subunit
MALARTLDDLAQRGQTTVVVTHDMGFAMAVADRILEMRAGKVVSEVLL